MANHILITGASGYLGGSLLAAVPTANLPTYDKLFALVRTDAQAQAVTQYGAEPITFDPFDSAAAHTAILIHNINIIFYLIDAFRPTGQLNLLHALGALKSQSQSSNRTYHFLHTTGAKIFSSHAGAPVDAPFIDSAPDFFAVHAAQVAPIPMMQTPVETNVAVTRLAAQLGVRSYVFAPCIVYGEGKGFGKRISIQTVAIVRAALACRRVYAVDAVEPEEEAARWPVCHVDDNTGLYLALLRGMLGGQEAPYGERGFYLASCGSVRWADLYHGMARRLRFRGRVETEAVVVADEEALGRMADGLRCEKGLVGLQLGGRCAMESRNGREGLGWRPKFEKEHILSEEGAGEEVDLILRVLGENGKS